MVFEKKIVGARVFYVEDEQEVAFTKREWDDARARYQKALFKKMVSSKQNG